MINITLFLPKMYTDYEDSKPLIDYLSIFQPTLDELNTDIELVPTIIDVDTCPDTILPYLASTIDYVYDFTATTDSQRKAIKELIDVYRRRGSEWSFEQLFKELGITAYVYNTIHDIMVPSWQNELSDNAYFEDGFYIAEGALELVIQDNIDKAKFDRYIQLIKEIKPAGFILWLRGVQQIFSIITFDTGASRFQISYDWTLTDILDYQNQTLLSESGSLSDDGQLDRYDFFNEMQVSDSWTMRGHVGELYDAASEYWFADNPYSMTSVNWYNWQQSVQITQTL
jgi:phage tail-like protein